MAEKLIFTLPSTRVDEPMYVALAQQAASEDRSMSYIVRKAIEQYLMGHSRIFYPDPAQDK
jgi:predicted transcriptional regulator